MAKQGGGSNALDTILTAHQQTVLIDIASEDYFTKKFYFTGGTALAEFYLRHRFSEDLDFFSEQEEINIGAVTKYIEARKSEWQFKKVDTRNVYGLWTFFLKFSDGSDLKIDFNYYPFPRIEKGKTFHKMAIDSMYDIAVNKVHTIAMKPRARDFIDIFFLVKENGYSFKDLLMQAKAKFDWDITAIQLGSRLLQASEAADYPRMLKPIDHNEWKQFFVEEARKLKDEIFE